MVRFTFGDQQSDIDHDFQVPLQRPTVDLGTQTFEALDSQAAVLKNVSEGLGLAPRKIMLLDEHIPSDGLLSVLSRLGELDGQLPQLQYDWQCCPPHLICLWQTGGRQTPPRKKGD